MADTSCVVVRGGWYDGRQGGSFAAGVSRQSAGAQRLCLHRLLLPPGTRGRPHVHAGHESAILIIAGTVEVWYGTDLAEHMVLAAGDYLYIGPDVPHLPVNSGLTDLIAVVARTDPDEQEGVRLVALPPALAERMSTIPVAAAG